MYKENIVVKNVLSAHLFVLNKDQFTSQFFSRVSKPVICRVITPQVIRYLMEMSIQFTYYIIRCIFKTIRTIVNASY